MSSKPHHPQTYAILVFGASVSGCSSFLAAICDDVWLEEEEVRRRQLDKAYQTGEKEGGGLIIDFGQIYIPPEAVFYFFTNTRGVIHDKYESIQWDFIDAKSLGIVILADATAPETFNLTNAIIHNISHLTSLPYVVAANKQDLPDAWTADDIRIVLSIPPEIPVLACSTRDKKSVANVLIALCEEIIKASEAQEAEF